VRAEETAAPNATPLDALIGATRSALASLFTVSSCAIGHRPGWRLHGRPLGVW